MFYVLCYGSNHYAGGTQGGVQYLQSHANIPMDFLHSHKGSTPGVLSIPSQCTCIMCICVLVVWIIEYVDTAILKGCNVCISHDTVVDVSHNICLVYGIDLNTFYMYVHPGSDPVRHLASSSGREEWERCRKAVQELLNLKYGKCLYIERLYITNP